MTLGLFLVDHLPDGDQLRLSGDEGRHAARVRRMRVGEQILLGDGRGTVVTGEILSVAGDGLDVAVRDRCAQPQPDPRITVVQALAKGDRAELAVELLTELGGDEIVPWQADRCVVRWDVEQAERGVERWRRIAREATKQSRRAWLPEVNELALTADVSKRVAASAGALVLHESAGDPLTTAPLPVGGELVVVVGPEGGVTAEELATLTAAGAQPVRLGRPVLRTSTAGAAALAALSVHLGRWS